jgi:hypothetical protein
MGDAFDKTKGMEYEKELHDIIKVNAMKCLNSNNFGQEFKNNGGYKPSEYIINLLNSINDDIRNNNLTFDQIIQRNFLKFLHNRIGTPLRQLELPYVRKTDVKPFRKGQLVVWEKSYDTFEIVLFLDNKDMYIYNCASKDGNSIVIKDINKDLIYHFSDYETIKQDMKPGEPYMSMDYVIETYNL